MPSRRTLGKNIQYEAKNGLRRPLGWGDAIANSITAPYHDRITGDHDRWWVGEHRWKVFEVWPDLDRATYIYHIMYGYDYYDHVHHPQRYDTRWALMDENWKGL